MFGGLAYWLYFETGSYWPLILAEAGTYVIAAMLVISNFRRFSPGVVVSFLGFVAWSLPILTSCLISLPGPNLLLLRTITLGKVVSALGLILLTLENELAANTAATRRERRARQEMEAYSRLSLSRRRVEDFDRRAEQICRAVVENSRFGQAALVLLQPLGRIGWRVSGIRLATAKALETLVEQIPMADFLAVSQPAAEGSQTVKLDLRPWLKPGDDLERLHFTSAMAVPMTGRSATEGALFLADQKDAKIPCAPTTWFRWRC